MLTLYGDSPLDQSGKHVSVSIIWKMLEMHHMPHLSCFHGETAAMYPLANKMYYVAGCKYDGDCSCGYFGRQPLSVWRVELTGPPVNFTRIVQKPHILTEKYRLRAPAAIVSVGPLRNKGNSMNALPVAKQTRKKKGSKSSNGKSPCTF
jgi:hypothetical protein